MASNAPTPAPNDDASDEKIPRPPNSWIIYRADMAQALAAQDPHSQRSQADVSKIISHMWRNVDPQVKAEYERRAEIKKLEHSRMYPQYRYNPKSRAEKERAKEEKKQQKAEARSAGKRSKRTSAQASAQSSPALASLPFPFAGTLPAPSLYGLAGPSPPMSAANSPSPVANWNDCPTQAVNTPPAGPGNEYVIDPSLMTSSTNNAMTTRPYNGAQLEPSQQPLQPQPYAPGPSFTQSQIDVSPRYRLPSRHLRPDEPPYMVARKQHQQQRQEPYQTSPTEQLLGDNYQPATAVQTAEPEASENIDINVLSDGHGATASVADDPYSFELPPFSSTNMDNWAFDNPEFQSPYNYALANGAGDDCFQLQLNNVDQNNLADPSGPLEVELGNMLPWATILAQDTYDWPAENLTVTQTPEVEVPAQQNIVAQPDPQTYSALLALSLSQLETMGSSSSLSSQPPAEVAPEAQPYYDPGPNDSVFSDDFSSYINLEPTYDYQVPVVQTQPAPVEVPQSSSYRPPSGAVHSSIRRVAGSWNRSFAIMDVADA